jgi:hypothetical protein
MLPGTNAVIRSSYVHPVMHISFDDHKKFSLKSAQCLGYMIVVLGVLQYSFKQIGWLIIRQTTTSELLVVDQHLPRTVMTRVSIFIITYNNAQNRCTCNSCSESFQLKI